jgi:hypothetical protein
LAGEQLLHHALFDGGRFVAAGLEGADFGIHVGEDGGDGALFFNWLGKGINNSAIISKRADS